MGTNLPLTIITPVRNGGAYFRKTLESMRRQTCRDFEYLVLDALSTDGTGTLIETYRDVVTYTHSRADKGAVDAFNTGIEMARGDFIAFLSADDWLEADAVERIAEAARAHPAAEVVSFGLVEWQAGETGEPAFLAAYRDPDDGVFDLGNALYSPCISRCFSRALYLKHGLYRPEEYGHFSDRELQLRLALHSPRKIVIPKALYHFRRHAASATGNAESETIIKSMACNRRISQRYLMKPGIAEGQRQALLKWYGFAWVRELFFLLKGRRFKEVIKVALAGLFSHPVWCVRALLAPGMPEAYRGRASL